jgi:hypothetical protein
MRFERVFEDGNGQTFRAVIEVAEEGPELEAALQRLANKARGSMRKASRTVGVATALDGAVRVEVTAVAPVFVYRCKACGERLTYDSQLPEHRLNHRREAAVACEGSLELVTGGNES